VTTPTTPADPLPTEQPLPPLLPGSRLLHIGIPKTGTTALQTAAARRRDELRQHGVCYPGNSVNQREAVCALMGRRLGWAGAGDYVPDRRLWDRLRAEVESRPGQRSLISHEFVSESDDEQAARFLAELGEDLHVVITLRGLGALLTSSWQQYVKAGHRQTLNRWLKQVLLGPPDNPSATAFYRRNDQAAIVRRWADVVGTDRLTVVLADKTRPSQLTNAFEDMLALPRGLLQSLDGGGFAANRSLSLYEAELVRRMNTVVRENGYNWREFTALIRNGAVTRLLESRRPGPDETPIGLPGWAAEVAAEKAREYAEGVAAVGCRVVGDLGSLSAPVPSVPGNLARPTEVPMDAAVEAMSGLLSASTGRGAFFEVETRPGPSAMARLGRSERGQRWLRLNQMTAGASLPDLLAVTGLRLVRGVRRRLRR